MKKNVKCSMLISVRVMVLVFTVIYLFVVFINIVEPVEKKRNDLVNTIEVSVKNVEDASDTPVNILLWTKFSKGYNYMFGSNGRRFDGETSCPVKHCTLSSNRTWRPVEDYDAVVFHGPQFDANDLPPKRSPWQYYTYVSMESPSTFKVNSSFDNFFNWTATYRSDSDFFWPYYTTTDMNGNAVSRTTPINWDKYYSSLNVSNRSVVPTFDKKTKKVAWFASNCEAHNFREQYVKELQKYIEVDVYGKCGVLKCPRKDENACLEMVRSDYFFYIAFENSHCMDYMTEKAYSALLHDTIPLLFGRANYTNFIPPHSYLDANVMAPREMASLMDRLVSDPDEYAAYFWWKELLTFHHASDAYLHPFCEMCRTLKRSFLQPKMYESLERWWETLPNSSEPACIVPKIKLV